MSDRPGRLVRDADPHDASPRRIVYHVSTMPTLRAPIDFETARLSVRPAAAADAPFVCALWRDPRVMRFVGFPRGLPTTEPDVAERIQRGGGLSALLIASPRLTGQPIGQCMVGEPDGDGVCEPDIKLAPEHWGRGYGRELWSALVAQAFLRSSCAAVRGTPNVANAASIRMQEAAGMRRVGEGRHVFPDAMRGYTEPVSYVVYELGRDDWERREPSPHPAPTDQGAVSAQPRTTR